jgi:hypothetical protein
MGRRGRRHTFIAMVGVTVILAGCGGGSTEGGSKDHNDTVVASARKQERSKADVIARLRPLLQLHEYAGVDNAFTVPPGGEDVKLGEKGNECSIEDVAVDKDEVAFLRDNDHAILSPDGSTAVQVEIFMGTPYSVCLDAVRKALKW